MSVLLCLDEGPEFKVGSWIQREPTTYRAHHLSLSTTRINLDKCQIVLLSFFWQCFPHVETSRLICNAIN